jgi:hypothetical protein
MRYTLRKFRGTALLRALWHRHVLRYDYEVCEHCGRPVRHVWWCHDDKLWEQITGNAKPSGRESAAGIWCITCFDREAKKLGWIEWAPLNLRHLGSER